MRRRHEPVPVTHQWLRRVLRGYLNYHAVPDNMRRLAGFLQEIGRAWRHALLRRSNADACRGHASRGCFTNICHHAELSIHIPLSGFASTPLVGAVCSNTARTDLCEGRWVAIVPTATVYPLVPPSRNLQTKKKPAWTCGRKSSPICWTKPATPVCPEALQSRNARIAKEKSPHSRRRWAKADCLRILSSARTLASYSR